MTPALGWGAALGVALARGGGALLGASLPHSMWGMAGGQASAVAAVTITRGLWSDCGTDASGVTSCVPLVSLLTLPGYLQGSRVLAVLAMLLLLPALALGGSLAPAGPPAQQGALFYCWQGCWPWPLLFGSQSPSATSSSTPNTPECGGAMGGAMG
ncbi:uncharacterized protein PRD47_018954 [Ara ararauna]